MGNAITRDDLLVEKAKLEDGLKEIVEQFQRVHASQKGAIAGVDRLLEVLDERAAKSEAPPQFVPLADGSVELEPMSANGNGFAHEVGAKPHDQSA